MVYLFRFLTRESVLFFFFNDTATTEIYTLSLHDALPISSRRYGPWGASSTPSPWSTTPTPPGSDRKSTRLNSSHSQISYAVFCLKKKKKKKTPSTPEYNPEPKVSGRRGRTARTYTVHEFY